MNKEKIYGKNLDDINLVFTFKKTLTISKLRNLNFLKIQSMFQIFKSHLLARCKWGVMHMTYKTKLYLMMQETKA